MLLSLCALCIVVVGWWGRG